MQQDDHVPTTTLEFVRQWRPLDICDRLLLLKLIGAQNVGQLVKSEIPVGMLGEILQALLLPQGGASRQVVEDNTSGSLQAR